jgi:hypothetical protein
MTLEFDVTIASEDTETEVITYTWDNLGTSRQGVSLPATLTEIPAVFIENSGSRRLYADSMALEDFVIRGADFGSDPSYSACIEVHISEAQEVL